MTAILGYLDDRTFTDFLGLDAAGRRGIFSTASHRATAELDELSAGCGIGLFALVWGGKKSLIARNLLGGTGRLPAALAPRLGDAARTNARAEAILPDDDGHVVEYLDHGTPRRVRARHVILAAQAPFASRLIAAIAPEASAALGKMSYGAFLSVAVATKETRPDALGRRLRDGDARAGSSTCSRTSPTPCARRTSASPAAR